MEYSSENGSKQLNLLALKEKIRFLEHRLPSVLAQFGKNSVEYRMLEDELKNTRLKYIVKNT